VLAAVTAVVVAWMYISPYLALENLRRAALGRNAEALKEAVDFPDFRASLKEELNRQIARRAVEEMKKDDAGFPAIGSALAGSVVNILIDQLVSKLADTASCQH
jgi:hypothetical protein